MVVLKPFLQIPAATVYPRVEPIKPLTINFMLSDIPSSLILIGDAFGRVCFTTWSAAVAGTAALEVER